MKGELYRYPCFTEVETKTEVIAHGHMQKVSDLGGFATLNPALYPGGQTFCPLTIPELYHYKQVATSSPHIMSYRVFPALFRNPFKNWYHS